VLLRTQRGLDSARVCFVLAVYRRRRAPEEVITDKHPTSVRASRDEVPGATHTQSGLYRKSDPGTKPIERSHVPTKGRLRPMRGLQSIRTGCRAIEGIELTRSVRQGHVATPAARQDGDAGQHARTRAAATTFLWLADGLRVAASPGHSGNCIPV